MDDFQFGNLVPWVLVAITFLWNLVLWFGRRDVARFDKGLSRIDAIEKNMISRDELKTAMQDIEMRHNMMHVENRAYFEKIMDKMDANEERRSKTEHAINNTVNEVKVQVAVLKVLAEKNGAKSDAQ